MGFGDLYHKHPLSAEFCSASGAICFHCRERVSDYWTYSCSRCHFYVHRSCHSFPETIRHPLHHQHPLNLLALFASSGDTVASLCNKCERPCLEGYVYHCPTCQFILHLKCFFTLDDHEKHRHPLVFVYSGYFIMPFYNDYSCRICGHEIKGFHFACTDCNFFVHYDCTFIPPTIKHHHVHELTIRHDFPKECDQVYCDICEDKDGELDRRLSYYYCKHCDYIAHVRCITPPNEDTMLFKHFTHEHSLRLRTENLLCCNQCDYTVNTQRLATENLLCGNQYDYTVNTQSTEYPSLIKHPRHPEHSVTYVMRDHLLKCTDCEFSSDVQHPFRFFHPYGEIPFLFFAATYVESWGRVLE